MNVEKRAKFYARVLLALLAHQGLSGARVASAARGARHISLGVKLIDPTELDKALKLAEAVALRANTENVIAQRQTGLLIYQFQLSQGLWEFYTRADLPDPAAVGLGEQRSPVILRLDPPHLLIAGTTGAGKTVMLQSGLMALVRTYPVADLGLILIDPHRALDEFINEEHLVLPIAVSPGDIRTALMFAYNELNRRKAQNIKDGKTLVVAIDEAAADEVLKDQVNLEAIRQLSAQARKYHIHLILGTQKPTQKELPDIIDKLNNRWVGQLDNAHTSSRVTGHSGLQAHKLTGKGDFLHITGPDVTRLQVAECTEDDFKKLRRREATPVVVPDRAVVELPPEPELPVDLPDLPTPGRPQICLNPEWLAYYSFHGPDAISRSMATEMGHTRTFHELHRNEGREFVKAYYRLVRQNRGIGFLVKTMLSGYKLLKG